MKILKLILDYFVNTLMIIGLIMLPFIYIINRKNIYRAIKEGFAQREYVKLILYLILLAFAISAALNLALFKLGLIQERFWTIKEYLISLYFVFGSAELLLKRRKIIYDIRKVKETTGNWGIFWLGLAYIVGALTFGCYIFGY